MPWKVVSLGREPKTDEVPGNLIKAAAAGQSENTQELHLNLHFLLMSAMLFTTWLQI